MFRTLKELQEQVLASRVGTKRIRVSEKVDRHDDIALNIAHITA